MSSGSQVAARDGVDVMWTQVVSSARDGDASQVGGELGVDSPLGLLVLVAGPRGLREVRWPADRWDETPTQGSDASPGARGQWWGDDRWDEALTPGSQAHLVAPVRRSDGSAVLASGWAADQGVRPPVNRDKAAEPMHPERAAIGQILAATSQQLADYFSGTRRIFDLPLDPVGSAFQQRAWAVLRSIPYGETLSYGQQASRVGGARYSRAVGGANGRNPLPIVVPCHRVVGSGGRLTGFAAGVGRKAWLLDHERRVASA